MADLQKEAVFCPICRGLTGYWYHLCPDCNYDWEGLTIDGLNQNLCPICGKEIEPSWVYACNCSPESREVYWQQVGRLLRLITAVRGPFQKEM
jgi:predicted amidophosphoribosyltransferase